MNGPEDNSRDNPDPMFTSALDTVSGPPVSPNSPSELVKSFQLLMITSTPSAKTVEALGQIKSLLEGEIDTASERSSAAASIPSQPENDDEVTWNLDKEVETGENRDRETTPTVANPQPNQELSSLVEHHPELIETSTLESVLADFYLAPGNSSRKYTWFSSNNVPYTFGGITLHSRNIKCYANISALLVWLNTEMGTDLNSCLVTQYKSQDIALGFHQDNEDLFDPNSSIFNVSLGSSRTIEFRDAPTATTGTLIHSVFLQEGSVLIMKRGCQERLWHRVLRHPDDSTQQTPRFCLSFRRVVASPRVTEVSILQESQKSQAPAPSPPKALIPPPPPQPEAHKMEQAAPVVEETPPDQWNLTGVHPSRIPLMMKKQSIPAPDEKATQPAYNNVPPLPSHQGYQPPPLLKTAGPPKLNSPKHIILGDSMVKGLEDGLGPEVLILARGGGHPKDILELLDESSNILPPTSYAEIESVALCVGTNALDWSEKCHVPLLQVLSDYDNLVRELRRRFPKAVIGLHNVLPRQCSNFQMNLRIVDFNSFCRTHIVPSYDKLVWIGNANKFLHRDYRGDTFLIPKYYGKDFLHLSAEGKKLMRDTIGDAIFNSKLFNQQA